MPSQSFVNKYGPSPQIKEISIRNEAPEGLRALLFNSIVKSKLPYKYARALICSVLNKIPDPTNWSDSNIEHEINYLVQECEWYSIYEIIQEFYEKINHDEKPTFEKKVNEYFLQNGIGWKFEKGLIEYRGDEVFEDSVRAVISVLDTANLHTSKTEISEAIKDLSRRPEPDITGAIQHSIACLECVMRECTGDKKSTLGNLLKKNTDFIPAPLDQAVIKIWVYACQNGRHIIEGSSTEYLEAELIVSISAVLSSYLTQKFKPMNVEDIIPF